MTDTETELGDAFDEATTAAERAYAERDDGSLPEDERESLRESTDRLASAVSSASVAELLEATGFEDVPDDASPVDLPSVIRDADAAAIVGLRRLLRLADLGESWSDLSDEGRIDRLDDVVGDEDEDDGGFAQLKEYLDQFGHLGGEDADDAPDESTDDEEGADDGADEDEGPVDSLTDDGEDDADGDDEGILDSLTDDDESADDESDDGDDSGDEDDELVELEDHVDRIRAMFADAEGDAEEDEEAEDEEDDGLLGDDEDDEEDDDDEGGRTRSTAGSSRFSTVPSSRSDMGASTGYSTVRGKD